MNNEITPACQWTNGTEEVLILRCGAVGHAGFQWPTTVGATIEAPDWNDKPECGGGLHGWPWGLSMGDGKAPDWAETWIVFGAMPGDVVDLGGKCKAKKAIVRFVGDWRAAANFVLSGQIRWVQQASRGASSATGERGAASATGERGAASATGWNGAASATGESGAASATGSKGAASATGSKGAAVVTGADGKAQAGTFGCIALSWWNSEKQRYEMRCAEVGVGDGSDGKLKACIWYCMSADGKFTEVI